MEKTSVSQQMLTVQKQLQKEKAKYPSTKKPPKNGGGKIKQFLLKLLNFPVEEIATTANSEQAVLQWLQKNAPAHTEANKLNLDSMLEAFAAEFGVDATGTLVGLLDSAVAKEASVGPQFIRRGEYIYSRTTERIALNPDDAAMVLRGVGQGLAGLSKKLKSPDTDALSDLDDYIGDLSTLRDELAEGLFKKTLK